MNRSNLYGRAQVLVGDTTTHGGVVLAGSPYSSWHGIPIARKGDTVSCPRCPPHIFQIAEGLDQMRDYELPMSGEGHKTTCGAALIAKAAPASARGAAIAANGKVPADHGLPFDRFFLVRDRATGLGKPGVPYRITLADGGEVLGVTDERGHTAKVYSDTPITATLEAPFHGNDSISEDGHSDNPHGSDACSC